MITLLVTGVLVLWLKWNWVIPNAWFWVKMAGIAAMLVFIGLNEMNDESLIHAKVAVKLLVAIAVAACAEIAAARARKGEPKPALVDAAAGLTVLNVLVAVLWH